MSGLLSFVENIGTYASLAEGAYTAVENVIPEVEDEVKIDWSTVQPALAALKTSFTAIEAAGGFVEKVEEVGTFLGKCLAFVVAVSAAIVEGAESSAEIDAVTLVQKLSADVKDLLGSPAAVAQATQPDTTDALNAAGAATS